MSPEEKALPKVPWYIHSLEEKIWRDVTNNLVLRQARLSGEGTLQ